MISKQKLAFLHYAIVTFAALSFLNADTGS